jgi:hypothetical protein
MLAGLLRATSCCMLLVRPWRLRQPEMGGKQRPLIPSLSLTINLYTVVICQRMNIHMLVLQEYLIERLATNFLIWLFDLCVAFSDCMEHIEADTSLFGM